MIARLRRRFSAGLTSNQLILLTSVVLVAIFNQSFFAQTLSIYSPNRSNLLALATLPVTLGLATCLMFGLVAAGRLTKPVLALALFISALSAYFMDSYGVVINDEMLQNVAQTNAAEAFDLMNPRLLTYLALLGALPAWILLRIPLRSRSWRIEIGTRIAFIVICMAAIIAIGLGFGDFYASFIREHKSIRSYANPTYPVYSVFKYANLRMAAASPKPLLKIGEDARRPAHAPRKLIVLVVGETARTDRFSLNGYPRPTNPQLGKEAVVSFTQFTSCGTSTAISVPCMFSNFGRENFSVVAARNQENVLDVIQRSGAYVLWLDNNSDSKSVANRIPFQLYRSPDTNPVCDEECRDEGMLARLQEMIDSRPAGDIVIVLHQMGNHGPAYYKRYPKAFEKFTPTCRNNDLSQCSTEEISNAYDNAILYTDHFLAQTITLLKRNDGAFATAMFYLSDHGESLGENGVYLHGLPYAVAPKEQIQVPAVMWFGANFKTLDIDMLRKKRDMPLTHDWLFHTLLGFLQIETAVYRPELDILQHARRPEPR